MSKHWNPNDEMAWLNAAEELARPPKPAWPAGATAGLVLVAASCLALGLVLYQVAGARDVVDESVARL